MIRVDLTFSKFQWRRSMSMTFGSYVPLLGLDLIDHAVSCVYDELPQTSDSECMAYIELYDGVDVLVCEDELQTGEEWLRELLTYAELSLIGEGSACLN